MAVNQGQNPPRLPVPTRLTFLCSELPRVENPEPDARCSICQGPPKRYSYVSCGHAFCKYCIRHWLAHNDTCPECRARLVQPEDPPPLTRDSVSHDVMALVTPDEVIPGHFPFTNAEYLEAILYAMEYYDSLGRLKEPGEGDNEWRYERWGESAFVCRQYLGPAIVAMSSLLEVYALRYNAVWVSAEWRMVVRTLWAVLSDMEHQQWNARLLAATMRDHLRRAFNSAGVQWQLSAFDPMNLHFCGGSDLELLLEYIAYHCMTVSLVRNGRLRLEAPQNRY